MERAGEKKGGGGAETIRCSNSLEGQLQVSRRKTGALEQSREGEDGGRRTEGRGQARTAGALHAVPAGM